MSTGTTITCTCGSHAFIIVSSATGQRVDLKSLPAPRSESAIDPTNLKAHAPLDLSQLQMVCASCHRPLAQ